MTRDWRTGEEAGTVLLPAPQDRPQRSKSYAELDIGERWEWHTEVYAFRRVTLGIFDETSPCDPTGTWFVRSMVDDAERAKRAKIEEMNRRRHGARDAEMIAEGREICGRWAIANGFSDFAAAEHAGKSHADVIRSFAAPKSMPWGANAKWRGSAADLGVTAHEYAPTAEELRQGRVALGLEAPPESERSAVIAR